MIAQPDEPTLTAAEIGVVLDALDALEYWQIGIDLPRHDGLVWLPGDSVDDVDRVWDERAPTPEEQEAIDEVREVRLLADRLRAQLGRR